MSGHAHVWRGVATVRRGIFRRRWFLVLACSCGKTMMAEVQQ